MKNVTWIGITFVGLFLMLESDALAQRHRRACVPSPHWGHVYASPQAYAYQNDFMRRMPRRASIADFRGQTFHYLDGNFYRRGRRGFQMVRPPLGIVIYDRPQRAERVIFRGQVYFRSGQHWFVKSRRQRAFILVRNPFR